MAAPIAAHIKTACYELGGTAEDLDINTTCTDDLILVIKNIDGINEIVDMFLMHSCMKLCAGELKD